MVVRTAQTQRLARCHNRPEHRPVLVMPVPVRYPRIKQQITSEDILRGRVETEVTPWRRRLPPERGFNVLYGVSWMILARAMDVSRCGTLL